jgi:redox-sensitive bicupin YhaK (pirin superfamily)
MSNLEAEPREQVCAPGPVPGTGTEPAGSPASGAADGSAPGSAGSRVEVVTSREVPLGGPRAMPVRRTLPQRARSLVGAWCFADHYGPDDVAVTGGMDVAPHPHTGLQTVSWLFTGEIEHRDSHGVHARVRPGELNLMTGGSGIAHSEVTTQDTTVLHGVQLWVALPEAHRRAPRNFQHYAPPLVEFPGGRARVFLGTAFGSTSPVEVFSPLLGAEVEIDAGASVRLALDPAFEHGFLVDRGAPVVDGTALARAELGYLGTGPDSVEVQAGEEPVRLVLLGGEPFGEEIVMWWNFVGRTHEDIAQARADWEAGAERFGTVEGYVGERDRLPAPALPQVRIRARRNPPTAAPR